MAPECSIVNPAGACSADPKTPGAKEYAPLNEFEKDPNNLTNYSAIEEYCKQHYSSLVREAARQGASPQKKIMAAIALINKGKEGIDPSLFAKAEQLLADIPSCCYAFTCNYLRGEIAFQQGDWEKAKQLFRKGLSFSNAHLFNYRMMIIEFISGAYFDAQVYASMFPERRYGESFLRYFPDLDLYRIEIDLGLSEVGDFDNLRQAEDRFKFGLYTEMGSSRRKIVGARILISQGRFVPGRETLEALIKEEPDNSYLLFTLGGLEKKLTHYQKAVEYYRQAVMHAEKSRDPVIRKYAERAREKLDEIEQIRKELQPFLKEPI